jgi:hypothetical protein
MTLNQSPIQWPTLQRSEGGNRNLSLGYGRATPVRIGRTRPEDRDRAPAFTLNNQDGNSLSSAELLAKGPLVITFFRGHW